MLRIYCDKNIFANIKESKSNFNSQLKSLMDELKDKMIFTYSEAHHSDLANSDQKYWDEDLELMSQYVKDHYFEYDVQKKNTECFLAEPKSSFYNIDFDARKNTIQSVTDLFDEVLEPMEDESPEMIIARNLLNNLLNLPMPNLIPETADPKQKEYLKKFLPDSENLTMRGMMNHMLTAGTKLLNDRTEVIEMKKMVKEYVSSEKYSFEIWKDKFDEKFKESFGDKSFTEMMETVFANNTAYNEYEKFGLFFNSLELYNVTKDKPLRKTQNLQSITTDANHAWYASFSDFLVTDDKGMLAKTYITYKYFGIKTEILDTKSFVSRKSLFLQQEEKETNQFFDSLNYEIRNSLILRSSKDQSLQQTVVIKNQHKFFNYFNRISVKNGYVILYCQRHKNANFVMYRELELLVNKTVALFGNDADGKGYYDFDAEDSSADILRHWLFSKFELTLGSAENNGGVCLSLTLTIKNDEEPATTVNFRH